jgi:hypothetical protein
VVAGLGFNDDGLNLPIATLREFDDVDVEVELPDN